MHGIACTVLIDECRKYFTYQNINPALPSLIVRAVISVRFIVVSVSRFVSVLAHCINGLERNRETCSTAILNGAVNMWLFICQYHSSAIIIVCQRKEGCRPKFGYFANTAQHIYCGE